MGTLNWWRRVDWGRWWGALVTTLKFLWILGWMVTAFAWSYTTAKSEVPALGWQPRLNYTLPYLPLNAVIYADFANREGGFWRGGGMGSPDGRPYTLEQFKADTAGQVTTLVATNVRDLYVEYPGRLYVTYWARRPDGATVHFLTPLGESPAGTKIGRYEMAETERIHPELIGGQLAVTYNFVQDESNIVFWAIVAALVGAFTAFGVIRILGLLRDAAVGVWWFLPPRRRRGKR